jgi:hypothetical protein
MLHPPNIIFKAMPIKITPTDQMGLRLTIGGQGHPCHYIALAHRSVTMHFYPNITGAV